MAYKPQFGLMIPLALAAGGYWRTFAAAAATVVALALAATLAFGLSVWEAFFASTHFTRVVVLEAGDTGWHKIQSVFAWVRMWGGSIPLAYAVQGAVTLAVGAALVWLWRSKAAYPLKAAALVIAVILGTPYSLDYDLMVLAPAIAFLAADGLARGFGSLREDRARGAVADAAHRPHGGARRAHSARRADDAGGVRAGAAAGGSPISAALRGGNLRRNR